MPPTHFHDTIKYYKNNTRRANKGGAVSSNNIVKLSDFKCGFEYETLVYTNQDLDCSLRSQLENVYDGLIKQDVSKNIKSEPPGENLDNMKNLLKLHKKFKKFVKNYVKVVFAISLMQSKKFNFIINTPIDDARTYDPPNMPIDKKELTSEHPNTKYWLHEASQLKDKWLMTVDRSVKVTEKIHTYLFKSAISKRIQRAEIEKDNKCSLLVTNLELVSPVLNYLKDVKDDKGSFTTFFTHLEDLPTISFWNNKTSSNHVHVSYGSKMTPKNVFKQCVAWYVFEPLIMTMLLPDRRNNKFCKLMRRMVSLDDFMKIYSKKDGLTFEYLIEHFQITDPEIDRDKQRYVAFNMLNLLNDNDKRTIEVRSKHGSTSIKENRAWIMFIVHFMKTFANSELIDLDNYYFRTLLEFPYTKLIISKIRVEQPIIEGAIGAVVGSRISNFNQLVLPLIKEMFEMIIPHVKLSSDELLKDYLLELVIGINKKWKVFI